MDYCQLKTTYHPDWQDLQLLRGLLTQYNHGQIGAHALTSVASFARCPDDNRLIGGIYGWIQFGWLFIDLLWVEEGKRAEGLGSKLLAAAEVAARKKGIQRYYLTTSSFQALEFYLKHEYRLTDEMEMVADDGTPFLRYSLQKVEP